LSQDFQEQITQSEFDQVLHQLNRWGRWGIDDQRGALNLVAGDQLASAAQSVRLGRVVSLALPIGANGAPAWRHRFAPEYWMLRSRSDIERDMASGNTGMSVSDDALKFPLQASTHWDALSHVFHNGYMYNGQQPDVLNDDGAAFGSIMTAANGMVGRGILLDIPLLRGVPYLGIGDIVEAEDLQQSCEAFDIVIKPGDFIIVRTGRLGQAVATDTWGPEWSGGPNAGLGFSTIAWLAEQDVAAVACDNFSVEVIPAQTASIGQRAPLHSILVHGCGIHLGEMWFLEELHQVAQETGRYDFFLVAPPMLVGGAVGAPCNPQAIF